MFLRLLPLSLLVCVLSSCGPQAPQSEQYLQSVFDKLNIALAYEKICENGKHLETMDVNLYGNMQMIVAIYSGELIKNHPKASEEDIFKMINDRRDLINGRMEKVLTEHGCESDPAKDSEKLLNVLLKMRPWEVFGIVSKDLEKVGGKINMESPNIPHAPDKTEGMPIPQETR